jgi:hypothetical protein
MAPEFPQSWPRKRALVWEHLRMQSQDDPEARIRDLERPLADVARTSELGVGQDGSGAGYPPPPPPGYGAPYPAYGTPYPGYGDAYPGAQRKASSGFGGWWLVFAGLAIVVLAVGAGVVVFSANIFTLGSDTRPPVEPPSVAGGGGTVGKGPGQPSAPGGGSGDVPGGQPGIPGGSVVTATPGAPLSVSGVGKDETIDCNDGTVNVSGVDNTVTITGHCVSLTVSGVENVVTIDSADTIGASGFDNQVIYRSGSPEITSGGSNIVEQG